MRDLVEWPVLFYGVAVLMQADQHERFKWGPPLHWPTIGGWEQGHEARSDGALDCYSGVTLTENTQRRCYERVKLESRGILS